MSRPQAARVQALPSATAAALEDRDARGRLGQFFTPPRLVDGLVDLALAGFGLTGAGRPVRVLDPACGDGRFLAAVRDRLGDGSAATVELTGIDLDPAALDLAHERLPGAELIQTDALAHDWRGRSFDLVIGNPPFLSQLAAATTRGGRSRFGGGPYADAAAEFLALGVQLAEPDGGRVAMILPRSMLASRDAGPIRDAALAVAAWRALWWSTAPVFDAAVHTCAVVLERGRVQRTVARRRGLDFEVLPDAPLGPSWGALLLDDPPELPPASSSEGVALGDLAKVSIDFRDQYYGLVGAVGDDVDGPPLVTSGLIDPGTCAWGVRPVRFAKHRYAAPRVDLARLEPAILQWARRRLVPKLLVANQTRLIESVIDRDGAWLPSVPVLTVVPHDPGCLDQVQAVLSSDAASAWVRARAAGSGLSPSVIRLTPTLLAGIPVT